MNKRTDSPKIHTNSVMLFDENPHFLSSIGITQFWLQERPWVLYNWCPRLLLRSLPYTLRVFRVWEHCRLPMFQEPPDLISYSSTMYKYWQLIAFHQVRVIYQGFVSNLENMFFFIFRTKILFAMSQTVISVSFVKRRYGLQKKSLTNIEKFWSKNIFEKMFIDFFLRFFILENLRKITFFFRKKLFFQKYF